MGHHDTLVERLRCWEEESLELEPSRIPRNVLKVSPITFDIFRHPLNEIDQLVELPADLF